MTGSNKRPSAIKTELAVEWWPLDRVKPYPRIPRKVTDTAITKVAALITEFGWHQPIVVDGRGMILAATKGFPPMLGTTAGRDPAELRERFTRENGMTYFGGCFHWCPPAAGANGRLLISESRT